MKWIRERPGFYRLFNGGAHMGFIERGTAHQCRWWWKAWTVCGERTGCEYSLKQAKAGAEDAHMEAAT